MIGSIMAVIMRWCENAASAATAGMTTRIARHSLEPAARAMPAPIRSVRPVSVSAADMTNTEATMMAGSLANPERASTGVRMPVAASASSVSIAAMSMRMRSLMKSASVTRDDQQENDLFGSHGLGHAILRSIAHPCTIHRDENLPCRHWYRVCHGLRGSIAGSGRPGRGSQGAGYLRGPGTFFIHVPGRSRPGDPHSERHDPDRYGYPHRRRRRADRKRPDHRRWTVAVGACRGAGHRREWPMGHAGPDRRALSHGRVRKPGRRCAE